jgi:hypothetical protein
MGFETLRQTGEERRLYYNKATHASPSWTQIVNARNVKINAGGEEGDVSARDSGHTSNLPGRLTKELTFEWVYEKYNSGAAVEDILTDLLASYNSRGRTCYEFFDADADLVANVRGWRMIGYVASMEPTEDDNEGVVYSITVKYTDVWEAGAIVEPDWYTYS